MNQFKIIKNIYTEILDKRLLPKEDICYEGKFKRYIIDESKN